MIETERLRPWREADKPAFAAATDTESVLRHLDGVMTPETADAMMDRFPEGHPLCRHEVYMIERPSAPGD